MRVRLTRTIVTEAEISPEHLKGVKGLTAEQAVQRVNSGAYGYVTEAYDYLAANGWSRSTSDRTVAEIVASPVEPDDTADSDSLTVTDTGDGGAVPATV